MNPDKDSSDGRVGERRTRSVPRLAGFIFVCLAYFLLTALSAHLSAAPVGGHNSAEVVHLPPNAGIGKSKSVRAAAHETRASLTGDDAAVQTANADGNAPGQAVSGGPDLIAAVAAVATALLAICFQLVRHPSFAAFLAVLGVGRWHRSVVLHL